MKIAILIGAVLLGTAGVAATPAEAQRYGWDDRYRGGHGDRYDRGDRHDRWGREDRYGRDWRDGRRSYRGNGRGWNRGWGRDRSRIVCRTYRDYYGPVRRCFRVHR